MFYGSPELSRYLTSSVSRSVLRASPRSFIQYCSIKCDRRSLKRIILAFEGGVPPTPTHHQTQWFPHFHVNCLIPIGRIYNWKQINYTQFRSSNCVWNRSVFVDLLCGSGSGRQHPSPATSRVRCKFGRQGKTSSLLKRLLCCSCSSSTTAATKEH